MIFLYLKEHNKTGLKYLGKTIQDPYKYKGSGTRWISHLKENGYDIKTTILKECQNEDELKYWGEYYSNLWNIVVSENFANKTIEDGSGRSTGRPKGIPVSAETRLKMSQVRKGRSRPDLKGIPRTKEVKSKISEANKGQVPWTKGKQVTTETREKLSKAHTGMKKPWAGQYKKKIR